MARGRPLGCASGRRIQAELIESGSELGFNDCLIAATAIERGQELVTGDSDFDRVPELRVRTY
ncbi:type II toxin-antitoxin system VapC family toxin [Natronobeatus ordinarius]|uniref:type II toxin-antitoxin system VapC family toxin n=1 Tax=Natronobeatus ordinarius TaxID=2963433 RepID=UPI003CE53C1D